MTNSQPEESWRRFQPEEGIPNRLYLMRLVDDNDGLTLLLAGEDSDEATLRVRFDSYLSFRSTDEGDLLKTVSALGELTPWPFFLVENSAYLAWLHEQSCDIHQGRPVRHYAIATPDDIVEVLTLDDPELTWLHSGPKAPAS